MAVNYETTSNIVYLGGDTPNDGKCLGRDASDKIGFYGTTPATRPLVTAVGTTTATTTLNETKIDRLYSALETLGLIATTS